MRIYDTALYRRIRKAVKRQVLAGEAVCWRCGKPIQPHELWDLGHDDLDKSIIRGPEHRHENRATKTHAAQRRRKRTAAIW